MKLFAKRIALFCLAFLLGLLPVVTHAVTYTWDPVNGNGANDDGAGIWNTTTTNWTTDNGATNVLWVNSNDVIIGSGGGAAGTVTVGGTGTQTVNSILFNAPLSGNYTVSGGSIALGVASTNITVSNNATIGSILSSTGGFNKLNASTLTLSATNTYSGITVITGGVLSINKLQNGGVSSSLGISSNAAANLRFVGGNLTYTGIAANTDRLFTLSAGGTITQNGSGVLNFTNTGSIAHTNVGVARTLTLSGTQAGANTFSSVITDAGVSPGLTSFSKTAAGQWVLAATNTYTGITTLGGGTLSISTIGDGGVAGSIGAATSGQANIVFNGGALLYTGITTGTNRGMTFTGAGTINIPSNTLTLNGLLAGAGALTKSGNGTLVLAATNTRTGATTMSAGIVSINTISNGGIAGNLGAAAVASANIAFNGGSLRYTGVTTSTNRGMTFTGTGTLDIVSATLTDSGVLAGAGRFVKIGAGDLILTGTNTFTGILEFATGTLSVSSIGIGGIASSLGAATNASTNLVFTGGNLRYAGSTTSTDRGLTLSGATATIDIVASTLTTSGVVAGSGSLVKYGVGVLELSGANTYAGNTTVSQGELRITGSTALSSSVFVNASKLSGAGTINGSVAISNQAGSLLQPGNGTGSAGTLTVGSLNIAGSSVKVVAYTNGVTLSKVVSNGAVSLGGVTIDLGGTLPDGAYDVITGTSMAGSVVLGTHSSGTSGNQNLLLTSSTSVRLVVDTTPDVAPGTPDLQTASDTGSSSTDNITSVTTPNFDIACVTGSTVKLYSTTTLLGSVVCVGGSAAITSSALTDGIYSAIQALQVDAAGNSSPTSTPLVVSIDTGADAAPGVPDLQITSDSGTSTTDNVTSDTTPTFDITCLTGDTVTLYDGVTTLGTGTCIGGSVAVTSSSLGDGTYTTIVAKQADVAGNISSASAAMTVVIDTAPDASPSLPDLVAGSDTGISNTDNITAQAVLTFDLGCISGSFVRLYSTSTLVASGTCTAGIVTLAASALVDGTYSAIQATQEDPAGNVSVTSSALTVVIDATQDAAPGTPDLQALSDTGASSTDDITSDTTPSFAITCLTGDTVTLYDGVTVLGTGACIGGSAAITSSALVDGTYSAIQATQEDPAGNVSVTSSAMTVVISTVASAAPGAPDLQAASDSGISNADDITNDATPAFYLACVSGDEVRLYSTSTLLGSAICVGGAATITSSVLTDGVYSSLHAVQETPVGNISPTSSDLAITIDTLGAGETIEQSNTQPDPTNNPTSTFVVVFDEPIQPTSFTASDLDFSLSSAGGVAVTSVTQIAPMDNTTFSVVMRASSFGTMTPRVKNGGVLDLAGNANTISTSSDNTVTYNAFAPGSPTGLAATAGNKRVALTWVAPVSNGGSAITNYLVEYKQTGSVSYSVFAHPASSSTSITVTGLTNGISHEFQVSAINAAATSSPSLLVSATPAAPVVVSSGGSGGGGGGGSYVPAPIAPDTGDVERLKTMTTLGYAIHNLVKLKDDGNPKTQEDSAVYYLGADGRRHAFPDPRVYQSWYCDFSQVKIIPLSSLAQFPLGKNVTFRPGLRLVKFPTNPKVYLVQMGRILRPIKDEAMARVLLGDQWAKKVSDVADTFYLDYSFGEEIGTAELKAVLDQSPSFVSGELYIMGYSDEKQTSASSLSCTAVSSGVSVTPSTAPWSFKEFGPAYRFTTTLAPGDAINQDNRALQELLASLGADIYPDAQITGKYGALTAGAVGRFQASKGLDQTGTVGPATRAALNAIIIQKTAH